jgi:F-type H+-transporting ATPase subunit a
MAGEHFSYFNFLTPNPDLQKIALAVALGGGLVALALKAKAGLPSSFSSGSSLLESSATTLSSREIESAKLNPKFSLTGFFDTFIEFFAKYQDSILGKTNRRYLPFTATLFFFILSSNLIGLIPGMPAITTSVWVNVGMAVVVFFYFNFLGIKENGIKSYLAHFFATMTKWPLVVVGFLVFLLEAVISLPLRILTLNMRLYWNITADHIILDLFTNLLPPFFPFIFYFLATFVCFMQAFIFSTLSMVYILLAVGDGSQDEHH